MHARFVRMALEAETARVDCDRLTPADLNALQQLLDWRDVAVKARDAESFHLLDDQFHREICERSGLGFTCDVIRESKAPMDRVRFLSLSFASQKAYAEHVAYLAAIRDRNAPLAADKVRQHLNRNLDQIVRIRAENASCFTDES